MKISNTLWVRKISPQHWVGKALFLVIRCQAISVFMNTSIVQAPSVTVALVNFIYWALVKRASHNRGESDRVHRKGSHRPSHKKKESVMENQSRPRNVRKKE